MKFSNKDFFSKCDQIRVSLDLMQESSLHDVALTTNN